MLSKQIDQVAWHRRRDPLKLQKLSVLQTKVAAKSSWVYTNSPSLSWGKWMGLLKQKIFNTQKTASKETPFLQLAMKKWALTGSSAPWEADGNNFTLLG